MKKFFRFSFYPAFLCIGWLLAAKPLQALSRSEAEAFAHSGDQHFGEKEWEAAAADYQKALVFGKSPQILYNLGQTYAQLRKPGYSLACWLQLEKIRPHWKIAQQAQKQLYAENPNLAPIPFPWYHALFQLFTENTWKWITALFFWLFLLFYGRYRIRKNKTLLFLSSTFFVFFLGLTAILLFHHPYQQFCLLPNPTIGHYAPNAKSPTRHSWPMGTVCWIKSEVADFYFVSTFQSEDGWVKKSELISLF